MKLSLRGATRRRGLAMLVVLLALMALLALAAPFLWMTGQAEATAVRGVDAELVRMSLDDAARAARVELWALHDELDPTRRYDDLTELGLGESRDPRFWAQPAEDGTRFDAQAVDLAGRADLWSASPHLLGNLLGRASTLSRPLAPDDTELRLGSAGSFPTRGWLLVGGEIIGYRTRAGSLFSGLERGVGADEASDCGFQRPGTYPIGQPVVALEGLAFALWRAGQGVEPRIGARWGDVAPALAELLPPPLTLDEAGRPLEPAPEEDLVAVFERAFERTASFQAGYTGGRAWQRPARVLELPSPCQLVVSEWRWGNAGSTARIASSAGVEYGVVLDVLPGRVRLLDPLTLNHPARETEVQVLSRRPVNVNTAPVELLEALFRGVSLRESSERVSTEEARDLAALAVELRPFDGHQDLAERLLLPAADVLIGSAGEDPEETRRRALDLPRMGLLELDDVRALYANALNANDSSLGFSTAPLSYGARDLFELDVRASVERGAAERSGAARGSIEHVLPQMPLLALWDSQEEFDEALRLDRELPGWATGPRATSVFDPQRRSSPPARRFAHLSIDGGDDGRDAVALPTFPMRDPNGFARPWVVRLDDEGQRSGRMRHFDRSNSDFEGYGLAAAGPYSVQVGFQPASWLRPTDNFLRPFSLSFWADFEDVTEGVLLELGERVDTERMTLRLDADALRLRLLDAVGDHPDTAFEEALELTLPLDAGPAAGLLDGWAHLELDVAGAAPDRIDLRVDGMALTDPALPSRIQRRGMTALTGNLSGSDSNIQVESTDGFPDEPCVLQIGNELIEAVKSGPESFDATHILTGERAGFGGRFARERTEYAAGAYALPANTGVTNGAKGSYPAGTAVRLHGYSLRTIDNIPPLATDLASDLGPFAPGFVSGVNGGELGDEVLAEVTLFDGTIAEIVFGTGIADEVPQTIELSALDGGQTTEDVLGAFSAAGGYAVILQSRLTGAGGAGGTVQTPGGTPLWGMHVFRYSGKTGSGLNIAQWSVGSAELPLLTEADTPAGILTQAKALVIEYQDNWRLVDGQGNEVLTPDQANDDLKYLPIVVPISIPLTPNAEALLPVVPGRTEVAQIVEQAQAELTEWVRYDLFDGRDIVRHDPAVLLALYAAATTEGPGGDFRPPGPPVDGGDGGDDGPEGGTPGPTGGGTGPAGSGVLLPGAGAQDLPDGGPEALAAAQPAPAAAAAQGGTQGQGGAFWSSEIGVPPDVDWPATYSLRTVLNFRGVLGTHPQAHVQGSTVASVFRVRDAGSFTPEGGWPGRFDPIFAVDASPTDPGFPALVHRAHRPVNRLVATWVSGAGRTSASQTVTVVPESPQDANRFLVGLDRALGVGLPAGTNGSTDGGDGRHWSRLSKFPSGELPRLVQNLEWGTALDESPVANPVIDEIAFGASEVGEGFFVEVGDEGAAFVLALPLEEGETGTLTVLPGRARLMGGDFSLATQNASVLDELPTDAGMLQIGEELLYYVGLDPAIGTLTIAPGGRGVLGSRVQPHAVGETVRFLHAAEVTTLGASIDAGSDAIALTDPAGFAGEGTVLIDDELIHHTWLRGGALGMPRRSTEPGARDHRGPGLFRGRYGTAPAGHASGAVALRFPVRYWDRWEPRSDGPELHYAGFSLGVPGAFVEGFAFETTPPPSGSVRLGVLQRARPEVPWDGDPDRTPGLDLVYVASPDDGLFPLGQQTPLAEWRVFQEFLPGAFDARGQLQHGWKQTADLQRFVTSYFGAGRVLTSWAK